MFIVFKPFLGVPETHFYEIKATVSKPLIKTVSHIPEAVSGAQYPVFPNDGSPTVVTMKAK